MSGAGWPRGPENGTTAIAIALAMFWNHIHSVVEWLRCLRMMGRLGCVGQCQNECPRDRWLVEEQLGLMGLLREYLHLLHLREMMQQDLHPHQLHQRPEFQHHLLRRRVRRCLCRSHLARVGRCYT